MKKVLFTIAIIISIFFSLGIGAYAFFWYSVLQMYIVQPIAQDVQVTSEWQQIELTPPLNIKKQVQKISLKIEGYESKTTDNSFQIKLIDGTILNPEIILIDENNKKYQLKDCCRTYKGSTTDSAEFSLGIDSLPKDVKYKAVLIRSDKPFKCDITWIDNDLK